MIRIGVCAFVLHAAIATVGTSQSAKPRDPMAEIVDATVRYLHDNRTITGRKDTSNIRIKVSPALLEEGPPLARRVSESGERHHESAFDLVRLFPGAELVTVERARECGRYAPASCMTGGKSVVVTFAKPLIVGDSAQVDLLSQGSGWVSAADSLALAKSYSGTALTRQISLLRAGSSVRRSFLVRTKAGWVVLRVTTLSQT